MKPNWSYDAAGDVYDTNTGQKQKGGAADMDWNKKPAQDWTSGSDLPGGGDAPEGDQQQEDPWVSGQDLPGGGDQQDQPWVSGQDLPGGGDQQGSQQWNSGYDLPGGGDYSQGGDSGGGWNSGYDLPGGGNYGGGYGGGGGGRQISMGGGGAMGGGSGSLGGAGGGYGSYIPNGGQGMPGQGYSQGGSGRPMGGQPPMQPGQQNNQIPQAPNTGPPGAKITTTAPYAGGPQGYMQQAGFKSGGVGEMPTMANNLYSNFLKNPGDMVNNPAYKAIMDASLQAAQRAGLARGQQGGGTLQAELAKTGAGVAGQFMGQLGQMYQGGSQTEANRWQTQNQGNLAAGQLGGNLWQGVAADQFNRGVAYTNAQTNAQTQEGMGAYANQQNNQTPYVGANSGGYFGAPQTNGGGYVTPTMSNPYQYGGGQSMTPGNSSITQGGYSGGHVDSGWGKSNEYLPAVDDYSGGYGNAPTGSVGGLQEYATGNPNYNSSGSYTAPYQGVDPSTNYDAWNFNPMTQEQYYGTQT